VVWRLRQSIVHSLPFDGSGISQDHNQSRVPPRPSTDGTINRRSSGAQKSSSIFLLGYGRELGQSHEPVCLASPGSPAGDRRLPSWPRNQGKRNPGDVRSRIEVSGRLRVQQKPSRPRMTTPSPPRQLKQCWWLILYQYQRSLTLITDP
jgi:hypothetical protein